MVSAWSYAADIIDPPEPEAGDLTGYVEDELQGFLWSVPRQILESVATNYRTAVPACFASSKSWTMARLALAWVMIHRHRKPRVVTTASTYRQVRAILWQEMNEGHRLAGLPGQMNQTDWQMDVLGGRREVAVGLSTKDQTRMQGMHGDPTLVLIDEADGVPETIWDAAEGLIPNPEQDRIVAGGNPWDPLGRFAKVCRPGSGWHVIRIPADKTPNLTGEEVPEVVARQLITEAWVKDKERIWGKRDPRYVSKVLAHFPKDAENTLINLVWFEEAQKRKVQKQRPIELGVDVAGGGDTGGDESVIALRRGNWCRTVFRSRTVDTQELADEVAEWADDNGVTAIKIDATGMGKGVYDNLRHRRYPVIPVNNGSAARDTDFENLGTELAWHYRLLFQNGEVDIDGEHDEHGEDKMAQVVRRKWEKTPRGKIKLESKKDMKARGLASPDLFDADVLAFAPLAVPATNSDASANGSRARTITGDLMTKGA